MPTQEERLDTVEFNLRQFKTETIKAYSDMAYEMIIIKGLTEDSIKRLSILDRRMDRVETRLDTMDAHLGSVETRLGTMDAHLGTIETRLGAMDADLSQVKSMLVQILERLPKQA